MLPLDTLKQTQGELFVGGIDRMGGWFRWALRFGATLLFEGLFLPIPGTQLGSRLIEGKPYGDGDFGCHQHEKDQALPPGPHFPYRAVYRDARAFELISSVGCPYRR